MCRVLEFPCSTFRDYNWVKAYVTLCKCKYCMTIVLSKNNDVVSNLQSRVGKTGPLGPRSRVMVYCNKLSFCQNDPPIALGDHHLNLRLG